MKYYMFNSSIDSDSQTDIDSLISFVNDTEGPLTIGINTHGGVLATALFMLDMLNFHRNRIHLKALGHISSCGFIVWAGFKGEKSISPATSSLVHMSSREVGLRDDGKISEDHRVFIGTTKSTRKIQEDILIPELTPSQQEAFWAGQDIRIPHKQLENIARTHNKKNNMPQK